MGFGAGVEWVADLLPGGVEKVISGRASQPPDVGTARFQAALGLVLFGIDAGLLLSVAWLVRRDSQHLQKWRLGLYVAGITTGST
jgi:hypothetical protein